LNTLTYYFDPDEEGLSMLIAFFDEADECFDDAALGIEPKSIDFYFSALASAKKMELYRCFA